VSRSRAVATGVFGMLLAVCFAATAAPAPTPATQQLEWCKRLSARLSSLSVKNCQASALVPSGAFSHKGFPILTRRIPAAKGAPAQPLRVMLLGGIHGDELTASAIVFQWLLLMQTPDAQQLSWSVVPVVNPDGLLAPRPKRVNANGVDLNRNFPTPGWAEEAPRYWAQATRSDPRRFPGKTALSEPETRWLYDEMERFKPQVIISVHAPFGVLDFDGPAPAPTRFGRLLINRVGVYPGSLGNYSGRHKNVPVITIELPSATAMPPEAETLRIWRDMLAWIQRNVPEQELVSGNRAMRR
jgi:protein MpaA